MLRRWTLPVLALGCAGFMLNHLFFTNRDLPNLEPAVAPARAPYANLVAASGMVEPHSESISVGSPLPGVVAEVPVREGQRIAAGDLLFRLDDRELQAQLAVRLADLEAANSNLARVESRPRPEEIPPSLAKVRRAEASLTAEVDAFNRRQKLSASRMISEEELISARQAVAVAREALAQATSEHELLLAGSWEHDKIVARAQVAQAEMLVAQTRTELARLEVRAPIAADVLKVDVHPGEYVGTPAGSTLVVLGDLQQLNVRVTIDEQDLPRFQPGQPGKGFVRGDAEVPLDLQFVRVEPYVQAKHALSGDGAERVDTRVLEVLYALPRDTRRVYVGQQLDVFIETASPTTGATALRQLSLSK
ncbi:MAG: biotin/lipoyl-binding protein [Pirellulales bacterium]|nr:biotin/lipoyl-binding protein [Pirellulales bacterium]